MEELFGEDRCDAALYPQKQWVLVSCLCMGGQLLSLFPQETKPVPSSPRTHGKASQGSYSDIQSPKGQKRRRQPGFFRPLNVLLRQDVGYLLFLCPSMSEWHACLGVGLCHSTEPHVTFFVVLLCLLGNRLGGSTAAVCAVNQCRRAVCRSEERVQCLLWRIFN